MLNSFWGANVTNVSIVGFFRFKEENEPGVIPAPLPPFHDAHLRMDWSEILARFMLMIV